MKNEETARKLRDAFFFPFLLHKLNTLDFNLLIAYARVHTDVLRIVLIFIFIFHFISIFQFFICWEWVYYGLFYFYFLHSSRLLLSQKKEKKAPLLFHSAILPGFNKKGHFLSALMA